jgi:TRAP-type C4-dicarboxylate transport system permease small subunit
MKHYSLVLEKDRHLKWRALDLVEQILMILCGVTLAGFSTTVFFDVVTRTLGHPWLWLQEVTMTFFVYGVFIGAAAATRRNDHLCLSAITEAMRGRMRLVAETFNRLVVLGAALCVVYFGYLNFLAGFGNFRMPSMTPLDLRRLFCNDRRLHFFAGRGAVAPQTPLSGGGRLLQEPERGRVHLSVTELSASHPGVRAQNRRTGFPLSLE